MLLWHMPAARILMLRECLLLLLLQLELKLPSLPWMLLKLLLRIWALLEWLLLL